MCDVLVEDTEPVLNAAGHGHSSKDQSGDLIQKKKKNLTTCRIPNRILHHHSGIMPLVHGFSPIHKTSGCPISRAGCHNHTTRHLCSRPEINPSHDGGPKRWSAHEPTNDGAQDSGRYAQETNRTERRSQTGA